MKQLGLQITFVFEGERLLRKVTDQILSSSALWKMVIVFLTYTMNLTNVHSCLCCEWHATGHQALLQKG